MDTPKPSVLTYERVFPPAQWCYHEGQVASFCAGRVLRDAQRLSAFAPQCSDRTALLVQILPSPEDLDDPDGGPFLLAAAARWHRPSKALAPAFKVLVRRGEPLGAFAARLAASARLADPSGLRVLKAGGRGPYPLLRRCDLANFPPEDWRDPTDDANPMGGGADDEPEENSGSLLVFMDATEAL